MQHSSDPLVLRGGLIRNPLPSRDACVRDVLIEDGRIRGIADRIRKAEGTVVDATGLVIIPGLINLHVHITRRHLHQQRLDIPFRQGAPAVENLPDEIRALWGLRNAWTELSEGVTTVRDAGSKHHVSIRLRNALQQGIFGGPRILASGEPVAITGGHESHRYAGAREADGASEVRKAVREQLREGADWIKLMASGGIGGMPYREHPRYTEFTFDELEAGIQEAHKRGRQAMAHAMSDESARFCIQAGIDSIEHGVLMEEQTVIDAAAAGVALVPTISGIAKVYAREQAAGNARFADQLLREVLEPHKTLVSRAVKHRLRIGTGSDTLGSIAEEIALLVECGMSALQALTAATIESATILRMESEIGSIEVGKRADLTLLSSDPCKDDEAYHHVEEVVFGGQLLSRAHPEFLHRHSDRTSVGAS
jgi:imidazolonepropionase-like amidohydrolase